MVGAVAVELADRRVERDRDLLAGRVTGLLDRLDEQLDRVLVGGEVGREPALVADGRRQPLVVQHLLQHVVGLGAPPQRLAEDGRADRHDHELLEVDGVVGVHAAVQHVHHRHRQHVGVGAADVAVERQLEVIGGRLGHGQRGAEDRVGAEPALVVGAVEVEQLAVDGALVEGVEALQHAGDLAVDEPDRGLHALAAVALAAVAQLDRLVLAGRRAARHRRPSVRARRQHDFDLDGRVAARVEDLTAGDVDDLTHGRHTVPVAPSPRPARPMVGLALLDDGISSVCMRSSPVMSLRSIWTRSSGAVASSRR